MPGSRSGRVSTEVDLDTYRENIPRPSGPTLASGILVIAYVPQTGAV